MRWATRATAVVLAMVGMLSSTIVIAAPAAAAPTATLAMVPLPDTGDPCGLHYDVTYTAYGENNNLAVGGDSGVIVPPLTPGGPGVVCVSTPDNVSVADLGATIHSSSCRAADTIGVCEAPTIERVVISTGGGDDSIRVGPMPLGTQTVIEAGSGNDAIRALNGEQDIISCGDGYDVVIADSIDQVASDCEVVQLSA